MSMEPMPWPEPAGEVVRAVRAKNYGRKTPLAVAVRDRLGELFPDHEYAQAFGRTGPAGWSPGRLALVTVLQMAENLTDRQAADAVRDRLSWMYALGLDLADTGFDHTVLTQFRDRVIAHRLEEKVLDLLLARLRELGLLQAGGKQRSDSTHVISAVRDLNRLELAGESVRAGVQALSAAAPDWVAQVLDVSSWSRRYDTHIDVYRIPASAVGREQLAVSYAKDGYQLLRAVYDRRSPQWLRELPAVQVLRTVLVQNFRLDVDARGREHVTRRQAVSEGGDGRAPGALRIASPYDPDTRWAAKRDLFWNGFKLHVTETCTDAAQKDRNAPNLITDVATTASTVPDIQALPGIHAREKERGLLPERHYLDAGYSSAEAIRTALSRHGVALITPALLDTSRQARQKEGFATTNFTIDWKHRLAVCPMGQTSSSWSPCRQGNRPAIVVTFAKLTCRPCPARPQCTRARSGARQLSLPGEPHADVLLRQRRAEQDTHDWQADYALRSGVEGTIRQTVAVTGARRARYRGHAKTQLEHVTGACALNIHRLDAWWNERALDRSRVSHLARLEINLAKT